MLLITILILIFVLATYFKIFFFTGNDGYLYISYTLLHVNAFKEREQVVYTYKLFKINRNKEEPF